MIPPSFQNKVEKINEGTQRKGGAASASLKVVNV